MTQKELVELKQDVDAVRKVQSQLRTILMEKSEVDSSKVFYFFRGDYYAVDLVIDEIEEKWHGSESEFELVKKTIFEMRDRFASIKFRFETLAYDLCNYEWYVEELYKFMAKNADEKKSIEQQ